MPAPRPIALVNARLVDPASGYDGPGSVLAASGVISDVLQKPAIEGLSPEIETVDCGGAMLAPGLVDIRVKTGEPGAETKETLKSAARAAAVGGVTSIVVQPDTEPAVDEPSVVDFILRRARDIGLSKVYPAGAATKGLAGQEMAEIGLMREAGCLYVTDVDRPITNSQVMRRAMTYAHGFGVPFAHRPADPSLSELTAAHESEFAARMGLVAGPAIGERIMLERDLALAELTGATLIVDQLSTGDALESLERAKAKGLNVRATVSINHLSFNEIDIGDYRTFYKLSPPLRGEDDRQALVEALAGGLIDVVVSAHAPAPAEDKRLPFDEAAPGAVGLETLLPALLGLHHERRAPLIDLMAAVTLKPARLLGLDAGALAKGAPADLVVCDIGAPVKVDADRLISKSKNSPFDGRSLQGKVMLTLVDGRIVHDARV
ncbi:MAG TPA: dihydroorotase [Caulobacteraceae bacterium]|nr:dihydroorotase [Caulobacteraceae bacterium]